MTFGPLRRAQSDPVEDAKRSRREGIRLRATLNAAVVTMNIVWEDAWQRGEFVMLAVDPDALARLDDLVTRLLAPPDGSPTRSTATLRAAIAPKADLMRLSCAELRAARVDPWTMRSAILETESLLTSTESDAPSAPALYQAACIHVRRYVMLAAPRGAAGVEGRRQLAVEARAQALTELTAAVSASRAHKDWARHDPAFSHLLDEKDFQLVTQVPGSAVTIPFRDPWTAEPRPISEPRPGE